MRRPVLPVIAILAVLLVVGAAAAVFVVRGRQGDDRFVKPPSSLPAGQAVRDGLLLVRDQRLIVRDMRDGKEYVIKEAPQGRFYSVPRWSPDGARIAYVIDTPATGAVNQDWGSDLAISAPNGSDERIILPHSQPGTTITGLAWLPDGNTLLVGVSEPIRMGDRITGQAWRIEQHDLAGGRRPVVSDAGYPSVSPDGRTIAFLSQGVEHQPAGLWTVELNGSGPQLLAPLTPQAQNLPSMLYPRYAPDGSRIAYAAVNPDSADVQPPRRFVRRWPWQPRIAEAHGLPMDIWLIPAAGGTPQRLTHLSEDEPAPAWSPDGARMAVMATGGLYVVTAATGESRKLGLGAFGGQADWR